MKRFLLATAIAVAATATMPAFAGDVGVSVSIGQPGFYGHIDIGDMPQPEVIYSEPRIIERGYSEGPPVYLRVPPGHIKHWDKHCREYRACGQRVYFVRNDWYNREYVPRYRERHGDHRDDRHDDHRDDHDRDHGDDHDRGHGHGHDR